MAATHSFTPNTRPVAGPRVDLRVAFAECRHALLRHRRVAPRFHARGLLGTDPHSDSELQRLDGLRPIAGMPVGTFIQTAPRTVMAYLMQPIREQIKRTFRGR